MTVAQLGWPRLKGVSRDSSLPQFLPQKEGSQDGRTRSPCELEGPKEVWGTAPALSRRHSRSDCPGSEGGPLDPLWALLPAGHTERGHRPLPRAARTPSSGSHSASVKAPLASPRGRSCPAELSRRLTSFLPPVRRSECCGRGREQRSVPGDPAGGRVLWESVQPVLVPMATAAASWGAVVCMDSRPPPPPRPPRPSSLWPLLVFLCILFVN